MLGNVPEMLREMLRECSGKCSGKMLREMLWRNAPEILQAILWGTAPVNATWYDLAVRKILSEMLLKILWKML